MGNGIWKKKNPDVNSYGWVAIQTNKTNYHEGERVSGSIFMQILKPCNKTRLLLKIQGEEVVKIVKIITDDEGDDHESLNRSSRRIFRHNYTISSWESLLIGQYEIPFTFYLPSNIPSSFHEETFSYAAYIRYNIQAILEINIPKKLCLECTDELILRERIKPSPESFSHEIVTPLKTWCCIPRGFHILRVFFSKTCFTANMKVEAMIESDNTLSQLQNIEVNFSLVHRLRIDKRSYERSYGIVNFPGALARTSKRDMFATLRIPSFRENGHNMDRDAWPIGRYYFGLPFITKGNLIVSELFLKASCKLKGSCVQIPEILCPIQLIDPELTPNYPALPDSWNPQLLKQINFNIEPSKSHIDKKAQAKNKKMLEMNMIEEQV